MPQDKNSRRTRKTIPLLVKVMARQFLRTQGNKTNIANCDNSALRARVEEEERTMVSITMESFEQVQLDNWNTSSTHKSLLNDEEIKVNVSLDIGLKELIQTQLLVN